MQPTSTSSFPLTFSRFRTSGFDLSHRQAINEAQVKRNFNSTNSHYRRRHSTNSVYLTGAPGEPDFSQTLLGLSLMIYLMISKPFEVTNSTSFDYSSAVELLDQGQTPKLRPRLFYSLGVRTIADLDTIESTQPEPETPKKSSGPNNPEVSNPTLLSDTFRFVEAVLEVSGLGSTGAVCACVLLLRLLVMARIGLTPGNWRTLWLLSVVLVEKLHRDRPVRVRERYLSVLSGLSMSEFLGLELRMLRDLDFFTSISRQDYLKVYLELRGFVLDYVDRGLLAPPWTVTELRISI